MMNFILSIRKPLIIRVFLSAKKVFLHLYLNLVVWGIFNTKSVEDWNYLTKIMVNIFIHETYSRRCWMWIGERNLLGSRNVYIIPILRNLWREWLPSSDLLHFALRIDLEGFYDKISKPFSSLKIISTKICVWVSSRISQYRLFNYSSKYILKSF